MVMELAKKKRWEGSVSNIFYYFVSIMNIYIATILSYIFVRRILNLLIIGAWKYLFYKKISVS